MVAYIWTSIKAFCSVNTVQLVLCVWDNRVQRAEEEKYDQYHPRHQPLHKYQCVGCWGEMECVGCAGGWCVSVCVCARTRVHPHLTGCHQLPVRVNKLGGSEKTLLWKMLQLNYCILLLHQFVIHLFKENLFLSLPHSIGGREAKVE